MKVITARNVQQALPEALHVIRTQCFERDSRNGPVFQSPMPVTTHYQKPWERVLFWPERDANPFFHLFESLWMLAGRRDVKWLSQFNSRIATYSDDGREFHGAYGYRWRRHFGTDQLMEIATALRENPLCRRQVLGMWDPRCDLGAETKDIPCNDLVFFGMSPNGTLDMQVSCRSNDVVWGCYGANAVHFSILHEWMAAAIGTEMGSYWQTSFNWHGYLNTVQPLHDIADRANDVLSFKAVPPWDPYAQEQVTHFPLVSTDVVTWQGDLDMFMSEGERAVGYRDPFFKRVALPMLRAYRAFKNRDLGLERFVEAREAMQACKALDWKVASIQWLERREIAAINRGED